MAAEFFQEMRDAFNRNQPFVLCTVVERSGSTPGKIGQKMMVFNDGKIIGTVGGGINEERTRREALNLFGSGQAGKMLRFDLNNPLESNEPVCGGSVCVFIELFAHDPRLIIFGAGHIGGMLAKLAALVKFRVTIVDDRREFASQELFPQCENVICADYPKAVNEARIDERSLVVVVSPDHYKDKEIIEATLHFNPAYCGLICSAKKQVEMTRALKDAGIQDSKIESIFAPIGLNLGSKTPEDIAVEILAQLVAFRNGKIMKFAR